MTSQEVVNALRAITLDNCLEEDIFNLYGSMGQVGNIIAKYHPGQKNAPPNCFVRATVYDPKQETITHLSRLSYPPLKYSKSYQRASSPCRPMFYATRLRDFIPKNILNAQKTCLRETIADPTELYTTEKRVAISLWHTTMQLDLLAVFSWEDFQVNNTEMQEVNQGFNAFIQQSSPEIQNSTKLIYDYIGERFSVPVNANQWEYLPSAIFTHFILMSFRFNLHRELHGIVFPSTKVKGSELNVALLPGVVDKGLRCTSVIDCRFNEDGTVQFKKQGSVNDDGSLNFNESMDFRLAL